MGVSECFIAGGYYKPGSGILSSIREAIDYNGSVLKDILSKPSFVKSFGGLIEDEDKLSNAPKGYTKDHEHLELLKYKTFAVQRELSREEVLSTQFQDQLIELYQEMLPFRSDLNQAVTV